MNVEDDRADFFARRIDEHEQTVRTLAARLLEAVPGENNLHENIAQLLEVSSIIRARLQDRSIERENRETEIHSESYRALIERTGSQGRPRFAVSTSNAHDLRQLGFAWTDIAQMLSVSSITLRRRRYESDSSVGSYSDIPNNELDQIMREVLQTTPQAWRNLVRGALLSRGLLVQRSRIESSISRIDPVTTALHQRRRIIKRVYNVPCPNFLW